MPTKEEFQDAIFIGLTNACKDAYHFTGKINTKIKPEYIVTVNVAKGLFTLNNGQAGYGYEFIIKFEENTQLFATACAPLMIAHNILDIAIRNSHNTQRNGKIDICIYDQFENKPICPIEVKGFTPSKTAIVEDLQRNLQLLELVDINTGKSTLEFAFLVTLEENRNYLEEENINKGLVEIKEKYEKKLRDFRGKLEDKDIELTITTKTIAKNLISAEANSVGMDDIYIDEPYHFIGVVLTLERKRNRFI